MRTARSIGDKRTGAGELYDEITQLVERCLKGESDAIATLIKRYEHRVLGLCYRMLGQFQDAEDVAQETFVRAIHSLSRWDPDRAFEPWLFAIAGNRCRSALARRARRPLAHPIAETQAAPEVSSPQLNGLQEEIDRVLGVLRSEYRQAFQLFHEEELSYDEIAAVLDRPVGTVKTWVHRTRRAILRELHQRGVIAEYRHALR